MADLRFYITKNAWVWIQPAAKAKFIRIADLMGVEITQTLDDFTVTFETTNIEAARLLYSLRSERFELMAEIELPNIANGVAGLVEIAETTVEAGVRELVRFEFQLRSVAVYPFTALPKDPIDLCKGCLDFDGKTYNGIRLICAMHPYGPDEEGCPDFSPQNSSSEP